MRTQHSTRFAGRALLASTVLLSSEHLLAQDARPEPGAGQGTEPPRGLRLDDPAAFPGYTLLSPLQSKTTSLVDRKGRVVHEWKTQFGPGNSDYLLGNGHLLRCARVEDSPTFRGGGIGGRVQEFDWDGNLVWDYVVADATRHQHHDIEPLPNGNVLLIAWEAKSRAEMLARGRDADHVGENGLWPDMVLEVTPVRPDGGKIVWEWHAFDHLIQDRDPKLAGFGVVAEHPELFDVNADHRHDVPLTEDQRAKKAEREARMRATGYVGGADGEGGRDKQGDTRAGPPGGTPGEGRAGGPGTDAPRGRGGPRGPGGDGDWLHTNSIDYDAANDLVLLSSPRLNEIWVIDHSTTTAEAASHSGGKRGHGGDILWRWGNPRAYGHGTGKDRKLFGQHDARWIAQGMPGAGHVLVFNNGEGRAEPGYSSVDEIVLPFAPETGFTRAQGEAFGPRELAWTYSDKANFFSDFISGADRLPNGNTLVCEGAEGRVFEVTADGRVVWDYLNPLGGDLPMRGPGGRGPGGPGGRPGGGPPGADGGPPNGPDGAGPDGPGGPGGGRRRGGGGPGGMSKGSLFRATRIALDHPGLAGRKL